MTPLPIDERRVGRLADAADAADEDRSPGWKERRSAAYSALARACDLAAVNARISETTNDQ